MYRVAFLCCLVACAEPPATGEQPLTIEVTSVDADPRADGVGQAEIRVRWDDATEAFARTVVVTASDGVLGTGTQDDPRVVSGRATAGGVLVVPMTFGRTPGVVRVSAQAGEFAPAFAEIELTARGPDAVVLSAEGARLSGGESAAVTVEMLVDGAGARPSLGSQVWLRACCAHMDGPIACAGDPPLTAPVSVRLGAEGDAVEVTVTARSVDEPTDAFLVGALTPDPRCAADEDAVLRLRVE